MVSFFQFVKVSKEGCTWKTAVSGDNGVRANSSYGKGASCQVACGFLQDFFRCGMVDGNTDVNLGDLNVAHHAVAGQVEAGEVFFTAFFGDLGTGEGVGQDIWGERFVIAQRFFALGGIVQLACGIEFGDGGVIGSDQTTLTVIVPLIGNKWIQQQGQAGCEHNAEHEGGKFLIHIWTLLDVVEWGCGDAGRCFVRKTLFRTQDAAWEEGMLWQTRGNAASN